MATRTLEEQVVFISIVSIYPLFFIGGLYIWGPVLAWLLLSLYGLRWFFHQALPPSWLLTLWVIGSLTLFATLIIGHYNANAGLAKTIKSSVGWAKGWALFPIFVLAGYALSVRLSVISRACCWLGLHTLLFLAISIMAIPLGLDYLYTSPLKILGGADDQYFAVSFYGVNPESGLPRWRFFAPWAPAASLIGALILICAWYEQHRLLRTVGILGAMCLMLFCQSRLGWLVLPLTLGVLLAQPLVRRGHLWLISAVVACGLILVGPLLLEQLTDFKSAIENARPDSTRVRNALAEIALQRWSDEAPWFGHGIVERGPHAVEYMAIGTHHTWYGLLFVKGTLGLLAFAVPLVITIIWLGVRTIYTPLAWTGLALLLPITIYSFTENLEMLAYLLWPGLLALGVCIRNAQHLEKHHEAI